MPGELVPVVLDQSAHGEDGRAVAHDQEVSLRLELRDVDAHGALGLDDAVGLVHGGDVDLGGELGGHGDGGVLGPALDLHEVDAVVEVGVGGSDNSSVPVGEVVVSG